MGLNMFLSGKPFEEILPPKPEFVPLIITNLHFLPETQSAHSAEKHPGRVPLLCNDIIMLNLFGTPLYIH